MRLNGKRDIMRYLGKCEKNNRQWHMIKLRYGTIIYVLGAAGKRARYWTLSEWLNQLDLELSTPVHDVEHSRLVQHRHTLTESMRDARARMAA